MATSDLNKLLRKCAREDVEKYCLGALIKYPQIIPDVEIFAKEEYFYYPGNQKIFSAIKSLYDAKKDISPVLVTSFLHNIKFYKVDDKFDVADYVDALNEIYSVEPNKALHYFEELAKYWTARRIVEQTESVRKNVWENLNGSIQDLVVETERAYIDCVTSNVAALEEPIDLFANIRHFIEQNIKNPQDFAGIYVPFKLYREYFGDLLPGNMYVFAGPHKHGKSTILNSFAQEAALSDKNNCKVIVLDTELEPHEVAYRRVSSDAQINEYLFETGGWIKDIDVKSKVYKSVEKCEQIPGKIYHLRVARKPIDEVISIVRRWHSKHVGKDEECIIVYDYLKLTSEKITDSWKEYQVLGEKTDRLKDLGKELNAVVMAAVQTNSEEQVSLSKQICWFASNIYLFRCKNEEELQMYGDGYGSHILIPISTRKQGIRGRGFNDRIKVKNSRGQDIWRRNFINYDVNNFGLKEMGTLEDIVSGVLPLEDQTVTQDLDETDDLF